MRDEIPTDAELIARLNEEAEFYAASRIAELGRALLAADERARALAEAARVEERGACARICDERVHADKCAAAIRARGQAKADGSTA